MVILRYLALFVSVLMVFMYSIDKNFTYSLQKLYEYEMKVQCPNILSLKLVTDFKQI